MNTTPSVPVTKTPASAPIGAALAAAAVAAIQVIAPMATGTQPNYALIAATGLVVFLSSLGMALFHLQIPSAIQQAAVTEVTAGITAGIAAIATHSHPVAVEPLPAKPTEPAASGPVGGP